MAWQKQIRRSEKRKSSTRVFGAKQPKLRLCLGCFALYSEDQIVAKSFVAAEQHTPYANAGYIRDGMEQPMLFLHIKSSDICRKKFLLHIMLEKYMQ